MPAHTTPSTPSVQLTDVGLTWPDGSVALEGLTGVFGAGRTGLVGANGSGKSTLLRLIAGDLTATRGQVHTIGDVGYLPQTVTLDPSARLVDLLGVAERVDALHAIEAGDVASRHLEVLADDWDVETRAIIALDGIGFGPADLDRRVGEVSGGEAVLIALAGIRLQARPITVLDEPTNNLDRDGRTAVAELVRAWKGALIVVSHDEDLLEAMDDTAELYDGHLTVFGGPYQAWLDHLDREQAAAQQAERTAEQVVRTETRQRIEAETVLARRKRYADTDYLNKRRPRTIMKQRARQAQVSAGKLRNELDDTVVAAQDALAEARARIRAGTRIRLDLPDPELPASRRVAELLGPDASIVVQGPERIAVTGRNGSGKTRLLERLVHHDLADQPPPGGRLLTDRVGYLPQRGDHLDEHASVLDNVGRATSRAPGEVRARLAQLLLRGDTVDRVVAGLSGGERFRVALARLLLTDPVPQLLLLDEPTNSLDRETVDQLVDALLAYGGALIVVSHDERFLDRIEVTRRLEVQPDGRLVDR